MRKIQGRVNERMLQVIDRYFDNSDRQVLIEVMQNSRRAGATQLVFTITDNRLFLRDDGIGLDDPQKLVELADTGWEDDIKQKEDPAGAGIFSLFGREASFRSRGWAVDLPDSVFRGGSVEVREVPEIAGSELSFTFADKKKLVEALRALALTFPLDCYLDGKKLPHRRIREQALASQRVDDLGVELMLISLKEGYKLIREEERFDELHEWRNSHFWFQGLPFTAARTHTSLGVSLGGLVVHFELLTTEHFKPVLPDRTSLQAPSPEVVDKLSHLAWKLIYSQVAGLEHTLSRAHYERANLMGIDIGESVPMLRELSSSCLPFPHYSHSWIRLQDEDLEKALLLDPGGTDDCPKVYSYLLEGAAESGFDVFFIRNDQSGYKWYEKLKRRQVGDLKLVDENGSELFSFDSYGHGSTDLNSTITRVNRMELKVMADHDDEELLATLPLDQFVGVEGAYGYFGSDLPPVDSIFFIINNEDLLDDTVDTAVDHLLSAFEDTCSEEAYTRNNAYDDYVSYESNLSDLQEALRKQLNEILSLERGRSLLQDFIEDATHKIGEHLPPEGVSFYLTIKVDHKGCKTVRAMEKRRAR